MAEVTAVSIGDAVRVVDESYVEHVGLVTAVHGVFRKAGDIVETSVGTSGPLNADVVPCINVMFVSSDESKHDPYGRQVERLSSLQHLSQGPANMPTPGRYWDNL